MINATGNSTATEAIAVAPLSLNAPDFTFLKYEKTRPLVVLLSFVAWATQHPCIVSLWLPFNFFPLHGCIFNVMGSVLSGLNVFVCIH